MQTYIAVAAAVVVVLVLLVLAWRYTERNRQRALRERFGPEYDRAVEAHGGRSAAEKDLEARAKRVETYDIRPLGEADRRTFGESWRRVQARFVDDPRGAVSDADALVARAMQARGYPMADFEQRAADVSVDHPEVVANYRQAHDLAQRDRRGQATTEDLRQAMVHYRALFEDLLGEATARPVRTPTTGRAAGQTR